VTVANEHLTRAHRHLARQSEAQREAAATIAATLAANPTLEPIPNDTPEPKG
jgi:hypothetical protein